MPLNRPGSLTVRVLVNELVEIYDWETLGINLGIKKYKLQEIKRNRNNDGSLCKLDLFDLWLRSDIYASWPKLVDAVKKLDEYDNIVTTLNEKYLGIKISNTTYHSSMDATSSESFENPATKVSGTTSMEVGGEYTPFYRAVEAMKTRAPGQTADNKVVQIVEGVINHPEIDVNASNKDGSTLLHLAAANDDVTTAKALIALGARVDCVDSDNKTALDRATSYSRGVMELLKRVGGRTGEELKKKTADEGDTMDDECGDSVRIDEETHHILCLDSSAEMALVQLEILEQIEKETGRSIVESFEWLAGSGIGGFLLLIMIYSKEVKEKMSISELKVSYFKLWKELFEHKDSPQVKKTKLEKYAFEMFGNKRMCDRTNSKVLIGAIDKKTTHLKLQFYNNDNDSLTHVWKVACYTCATLGENEGFIDGGAMCKNLAASVVTYIMKNQVVKKTQSVTCLVSVGDGIWPSSPFTKDDDFHLCANNALAEQVHENLEARFDEHKYISYFRFNPLLPKETPQELHLESLIDLLVMIIVGFREGSEGFLYTTLKKLNSALNAF